MGIDLVYLVLGQMTIGSRPAYGPGELGDRGPLGNGFAPREPALLMVAGGIGQTPFPAVGPRASGSGAVLRRSGREIRYAGAHRVTLCYGARSADYLAGVEDFAALGRRRAHEHRRRHGRPSRPGDRPPRASP